MYRAQGWPKVGLALEANSILAGLMMAGGEDENLVMKVDSESEPGGFGVTPEA